MTSATAVLERIQDLAGRFSADCNEDEANKTSKSLLEEVEVLEKCSVVKEEKLLASIHTAGINLWNLVIAKKTGKKIGPFVCAGVRYVSLRLIFSANFQGNSQNASRKQLAMALKTGREWLDCNNHNLADRCFVLAAECYMKMLKLIGDGESTAQIHLTQTQLEESHQNMIKVYAFRAEVALIQSQHATAIEYLTKSKELMKKHKLLGEFLCGICYNFGLDLYQKELYSYSVEWLRESIDIGKDESSVKDERQATTGQLLAVVYMELNEESFYQKALYVIDESILLIKRNYKAQVEINTWAGANLNEMQPHIKSVFLKVKILLLLNEEEAKVLRAFNDMVIHPQVNLDLALECIELFNGKRKSLCHEGLNILNKKYPRLQENVRVQLAKLEILLSDNQEKEAIELINTELLRANNLGIEFDKSTLRKLQLLLWEQAQIAFEKKEFLTALQWYNFSAEIMRQSQDSDQHTNKAKLQRNRCSCLIELQNYDEATAAVTEAEADEPSSPHVHFLKFRIALLLKDNDQALIAVERLKELSLESSSDTVNGLISLSAQLAFENGNRSVSESLLEKMVGHVSNPKESLVTIRCLTRLKFTNLGSANEKSELQNVMQLVKKAHQVLKDLKESKGDLSAEENEVMWFNKIAWNLGLSCNTHFEEMQQSFILCYELSLLLPDNLINASQQKSALLMAIGSGLQVTRDSIYHTEKKIKLQELLKLINKCKDLVKEIQKSNAASPDTSEEYLLTYEFEAKTSLGCMDVDQILEETMSMPAGQAAMFETYANVALSLRGDAKEVGIKALKLAIKYHLDQETIDYSALSKNIHRLINASLQKGGSTNTEAKEDAYKYYEDALKIIENLKEGDYPEMELVWLMTKAWNCGIHLFSAHHYEAAEKWCVLSIKFLKHLNGLKNNYELHMSTVYADIVSRIQQEQGKLGTNV